MQLVFFQGDTFDFAGSIAARVNNAPMSDFTGWTARVQIRTEDGGFVAEPNFIWLDAAEGLARIYADNTGDWLVGSHLIAIKLFSPEGVEISAPPEQIRIRKALVK